MEDHGEPEYEHRYLVFGWIDGKETYIGETLVLEEAFQLATPFVEKAISVMIGGPDGYLVRWSGLIGHYALQAAFEDIIKARDVFVEQMRAIFDAQLAGKNDLWNFHAYLNGYMDQHNGMMRNSWVKDVAEHCLAEQGHRNAMAEIDLHGYEQYNLYHGVGWKDKKAYRAGIELLPDDPYWETMSLIEEDDNVDESGQPE